MKHVEPIAEAVRAKPHRPVYRMHRYFARRPYSVFEALVSHYSDPGDLVLDPFCGGGVSVVEAVVQGRQAVGIDLNPLAAFITRTELEPVDPAALQEAMAEVVKKAAPVVLDAFATECRHCSATAVAAWFEHSASASCSACSQSFLIANATKLRIGTWECPQCSTEVRFSPVADTPHEVVQLHYTCRHCGVEETAAPTVADHERARSMGDLLAQAEAEGLDVPIAPIPDCNMQRESALHKKGITQFRQLFTDRHLLTLMQLRRTILEDASPFEDFLLLAFSSTLRYTNRMVTLNPGWRGNRPLEWAKPGFWLPPVHVEANVLVEFSRRCDAVIRGKRDFARLGRAGEQRGEFRVEARSATELPLEDQSVDLVLTDPPYGSYVHYADLSNFWAVWLPERLGMGGLIDDTDEAVIARKRFPRAKTAADYQVLLEASFRECFRVLRPGAYMVMTFHNREPRAWAALFLAAVKAGFDLPENGVIFQDGVPSYKHTAQSRRTGSAIGDFIISFRRPTRQSRVKTTALPVDEGMFIDLVAEVLTAEGALDPPALLATVWLRAQPHVYAAARSAVASGEDAEAELLRSIDEIGLFDSHRRALLEAHFNYDGRKWSLRKTA